ncbi:MAG: hypothetical protein U0903_05025 [Planctomycetales bacterium]
MSGHTFLKSLSATALLRGPHLAPTEALESRMLLTLSSFNGALVGTFTGTATGFGSTINIPDPIFFPDNQILSTVKDGTISNKLPSTGTGNVTDNNNGTGTVSFGTIANILDLTSFRSGYAGTFTLGANGAAQRHGNVEHRCERVRNYRQRNMEYASDQ